MDERAVADEPDGFPAEVEEVALNDEPLPRTHIVQYSDPYSNASFLDDDDDATFISTAGLEDACPLHAAVQTPPIVETRMVGYVEDDDLDDHAFLKVRAAEPAMASYAPVSYSPVDDDVIEVADSEVQYVAANNSTVSYVPVDDDVGEIGGGEVIYVAANEIDQPCQVVARTCPDDINTDEISYIPVDEVDMQTVSYVSGR